MLEIKDLRARDVMSRLPEVVAPEQTVAEAYRLMADQKIGGTPVIHDDGRLVGVFTLRDLAACFEPVLGTSPPPPGFLEQVRKRRISECLERGPITCQLDTTLPEACALMIKEHVHRLVVMDGERAVGVLSSIDVVRSLACLGSMNCTMKGGECV